jgi:hypothetical protein
MEAKAMQEMREILCSLGVMDWLKERFPGDTEDALLEKIDRDFTGVLSDLLEQRGQ